ncbi:WD40 repeat domain-containing protein [Oscillatoria sp. FACHB-1407]|uniref:WD40 repeat domain-containing protein n=1 Tax=Oscillatoria sp. FACHB-1407 TaxID=2692847 RepID=UPI001688B554|nr:WD40 repeat domain-containing protein [Oscillatoria sp. FACHB-1407]MBD2462870.1 WD40 repeat domain-containing protein [Oscillatoria sp. FACHB-1407]
MRIKAIAALLTGMLSVGSTQITTLVWELEVDTRGTEGTIEAAEFAKSDRFIVTGSADGKVNVWQQSDRQLVWQSIYWDGSIDGKTGEVEAVAFSPDGEWVAAGGNSDGIKIYRGSDGELVAELGGDGADGIAFSNNGQYFAAPDKNTLRLYNPADWERYDDFRVRHDCDVNSIDFSPDDQYVLTGSCDRTVKITRIEDGDQVREIDAAEEGGSIKSVRVSPDGQWIATGNGPEGAVKIFRFADGELIATLNHDGTNVEAVAFSPDGRYLATAGGDPEDNSPSEHTSFRIYRVDGFELQEQIIAHAEGVEYLDFSPDSQYLLSAGEDGILKLWQLNEASTNVTSLTTVVVAGLGMLGIAGAIAFWYKGKRGKAKG